MPFDYLSVKLPESKKTGLNTIKIQMTLDKILFSLAMYPDMQLAEAFSRVGRLRNYLPFHLGDEIYAEIRADIIGRRKDLKNQPLVTIMQNLHDLWSEDYNINEIYKMVTGKQTVEQEEVEIVKIEKPKIYREDDLTPSEYLTYANVIEGIDVHLEIERKFHNPEVAPGRWWVITFVRFVLNGKMRPFILMARLNKEGKICYIQGAWPLDYLLTAIEKIIPLDYRAKHGDYIYLDIQVEAIQTKARGKLQKYSLIRRVNTATGE